MAKDQTPVIIDPTAAFRLGSDHEGFHCPLRTSRSDIEVSLRTLGVGDLTDPGVHWLEPDKTRSVPRHQRILAARTGWHTIRATRAIQPDALIVIASWLSEELDSPCNQQLCTHWDNPVWIVAHDADPAERNLEGARELARYFMLSWTEGPISWALKERKNDPYPELSSMALDEEVLLHRLTTEPWDLTPDDRDQMSDLGRRVGLLLNWDPAE